MGSLSDDLERLRQRLQRMEGVEVTRSGTNHFTVRKDGRVVATIASTPSKQGALANIVADLRRAGIEVGGGGYTPPKDRPEDEEARGRTAAGAESPTAATEAPGDTQSGGARPGAVSQPTEPVPYEEETQISFEISQGPRGWIYSRTRMLVRTERWTEPFDLPVGDPRPSRAATTRKAEKKPAPSAPPTPTPVPAPEAKPTAERSRPTAPATDAGSAGKGQRRQATATTNPSTSQGSPVRRDAGRSSGVDRGTPAPTRTSGASPSAPPAPARARPNRPPRPPKPPVSGPTPAQSTSASAAPTTQGAPGTAPARSKRGRGKWLSPVPYGSPCPVWETTREIDAPDRVILDVVARAKMAPLRKVVIESARRLGRQHTPPLYGRVYRLAREGRLGLMDDPHRERKLVHRVGQADGGGTGP